MGEEMTDEMMESITAGDFSSLGLSGVLTPTREAAQREAQERSADVLSSWQTLRQILERYEDSIRERWAKKSHSQRTSIITKSWPNISSKHRPDFEAFMKEGTAVKTSGTKFREAYMWPYINLEDLVKRRTLLLFLNSRGRHPPRLFAHADYHATRLGHVGRIIMPPFLNMHTMRLDGEELERYGQLVSWDEDQDLMMKTFHGLAHQPGEGLWILEIQQRILAFLVDCCKGILHDFDTSSFTSAPIKPEPGVATIADGSEWPTLASMAAEAPYRLPARLDFSRLKSLVAAQLNSSEDYIRNLREDPGYFSEELEEWADHRQEALLDIHGKRHPVLSQPLFWERVIGNVIGNAYQGLVVWGILNKQLINLSALQAKYADLITPSEPLPPEYMKALLTFQSSLERASKGPIQLLKTIVPASPAFRSSYIREPHIPGSSMVELRSVVGKKNNARMMWLFDSLWTQDQLLLLGLPNLMDEIEYLTQNDPEEKEKLSPLVSRVFSDLGLIARMRHELDIISHGLLDLTTHW